MTNTGSVNYYQEVHRHLTAVHDCSTLLCWHVFCLVFQQCATEDITGWQALIILCFVRIMHNSDSLSFTVQSDKQRKPERRCNELLQVSITPIERLPLNHTRKEGNTETSKRMNRVMTLFMEARTCLCQCKRMTALATEHSISDRELVTQEHKAGAHSRTNSC